MKAYLDAIIEAINAELTDNLGQFRAQVNGLVKIVPLDENETLLLEDSTGNRFAGVDDRFDITMWHRADVTEFTPQENTFGEGIDDYNAITQVTLYCYGNSLPGINAQKLGQQIQASMPSVVTITNQSEMGIGSNIVELNSINYNSLEVFSQVYDGIPYNLRVSDSLVAVSFTVTSEINKSCFDRCFNC